VLVRASRSALGLARVAHNARRSPRPQEDAPLVSVVIPTYNWSSVLRYSIASALSQTYPAIEVLVIGDGCTDDSEEVAASFADPRVRWHNLPTNSGSQSAPNNAGLELARGTYVAYHGHDDLWLPTHVALLMEAIVRTGAKAAHARCEYIGPEGRYRRIRGGAPPAVLPPSALLHETQLGRDTVWRNYREIAEDPDTDFITRVTERAGGIVTVAALTVFKFPSAWRRNSYVLKPCHEQQAYADRIARERLFVYREVAAVAWRRLMRDPDPRMVAKPDGPLPPGWHVTEMRKVRGLE
jgi:glycosyltransferase involved in cell wall biosynthesis